jgi:HEAT repeat protein
LNFDTVSDPLLRFALAAGLAVLMLSALMTLHILLLRLRLTLRQRRESRFTARWRPRFLESMQAIPLRLPRIASANWFIFLSLWNQYQESESPTARQRLKSLILQLRMDVAARELLTRGSIRVRLMAVLTLGHLGDRESWDKLHELSRSPHPLLSLAAARALLLIDASAALALLMADFTGRSDWSLARVETMLAEAGAKKISAQLAAAVDFTPPEQLPRLVALMAVARSEDAMPRIRELLEMSENEEILTSCLKSVHVPPDRDLIARFARHTSWQVRTQAARALLPAARPGDENLLVKMLADPVWWVRYRAAQSLVALPFLSNDDLWRLRWTLEDKFGVNMLDQVMAERKSP